MAKILPIVKEPHKILRKKASEIPVSAITSPAIKELIDSMKETLKNTPDGVGLAAPQVGKSLRLFIVSDEVEEIDTAERKQKEKNIASPVQFKKEEKPYEIREWHYHVFINPVVKKTSKQTLMGPEGCLSVPGKFGNVARKEKITVEAYNEHGKKITRGASKFFARVIQHELDHLEGTLFVDKTVGKVQHVNIT